MNDAISPTSLALLHNLDLSDSPSHVRSGYKALLAEVDRLTKQGAIKDEAIESLRRTLNHNLERADRLTAERDQARARVAELEAERGQLATNILGLKRFYDDNVHARFALGYAADLARGTKLELRDAAALDRSDGSE